MRRVLGLFLIAFLVAGAVPARASAQTDEDKGERADDATAASVRSFFEDFVDRFNAKDPDTIDTVDPALLSVAFSSETRAAAVSYLQTYASPITIYAVRDVRVHESGHVSAEVTYSGWIRPATFFTERWYLQPEGDTFTVAAIATRAPRVPDDWTTAEVDLTLSGDGPALSQAELPAADILVVHASNSDPDAFLTSALYVLPEDMSVADANAELQENNAALDYLGPTFVRPGDHATYAFLVEPGTTYLFQQFTQNENGTDPKIIEGVDSAATLTVGAAAQVSR